MPRVKRVIKRNYKEDSDDSSSDEDYRKISKNKRKTRKPCKIVPVWNTQKTKMQLRKSLITNNKREAIDEEMAKFQEHHENAIKSRVDSFFKGLGSDDDIQCNSYDNKVDYHSNNKDKKEFYMIPSSSESESEMPSTSGTSRVIETLTSKETQKGNKSINPVHETELVRKETDVMENKTNDLFDYVDDILKECNIVSTFKDKVKENLPGTSLEELMQKTNDIIGGVASYIDNLDGKKAEKKEIEKEAASCPVCLETLGGTVKVMVTICGHMFCEPCIVQVAKTVRKCPTCRKSVTKTKYHPIYL